MSSGLNEHHPLCRSCRSLPLVALTFAVLSCGSMFSQTASTGALTGVTLDPSGAVLPGVILHLTQGNGFCREVHHLRQQWPIRFLIAATRDL